MLKIREMTLQTVQCKCTPFRILRCEFKIGLSLSRRLSICRGRAESCTIHVMYNAGFFRPFHHKSQSWSFQCEFNIKFHGVMSWIVWIWWRSKDVFSCWLESVWQVQQHYLNTELVCSEPFARRGPLIRHFVDLNRTQVVCSTFYCMNGTQAHSLCTSSSEWACVSFTRRLLIEWAWGISIRIEELATKNYGNGDLFNWVKKSRNWSQSFKTAMLCTTRS